MANKIKLLVSLLLAVSLGAILHSFTSIPKGYAAPQSQSAFKQVLLQFKDKYASVGYERGSSGWQPVVTGKIITVGDDFVEVLKPNSSFSDYSQTYYFPFTSIQWAVKSDQNSMSIYLQ
jgi:hypothetical protein